MPEKMTIYSTLVGWLNSQDDKFGEEFVKYVLGQLNDMLLSSRWEAARYTVRFVSGKLIEKTVYFCLFCTGRYNLNSAGSSSSE